MLVDTVVALALSEEDKSNESFYLIKITKEEHSKETDATDEYGKTFDAGVNHLEGIFFERISGHDSVLFG